MRNHKARIIRRQGNDVTVTRYVNGIPTSYDTKALIGRMNKGVTNMKQLESFKEGIFLPDVDIDSGDFVRNHSQDENYVVSGTHFEPFKNTTLSVVCNLLKCNHLLTIKSLEKVADARGNLKNELVVKVQGVPCFVEKVTSDLRQIEAGIHPDTEYRVYTTALSVKETDQVALVIQGQEKTFKVTATDYDTFPKMLVLEVCSDVRK